MLQKGASVEGFALAPTKASSLQAENEHLRRELMLAKVELKHAKGNITDMGDAITELQENLQASYLWAQELEADLDEVNKELRCCQNHCRNQQSALKRKTQDLAGVHCLKFKWCRFVYHCLREAYSPVCLV
jgi:chromosome segregation ATPase